MPNEFIPFIAPKRSEYRNTICAIKLSETSLEFASALKALAVQEVPPHLAAGLRNHLTILATEIATTLQRPDLQPSTQSTA
ncbi:MAG TPA: hypothetical protein VF614_01700, partial [Chthoniobacteraceae bacterium]